MSNVQFVNVYRNGLGSKRFDSAEQARAYAGDKAIITALAVAAPGAEVEYINVYRNGIGSSRFKTADAARRHAGSKAIITALAVAKPVVAEPEPVQTLFDTDELADMVDEFDHLDGEDLIEAVVARTIERLADAE